MNRLFFIKIVITISLVTILVSLFNIQVINNQKYIENSKKLTEKIYYGQVAPRGRIYDRNGNIIVDNKPNKVIYYKKEVGTTKKEEIEISKQISKLIELNYDKVTTRNIKDYYLAVNTRNDLITKKELENYNNRKLSSNDLYNLKLDRLTEEDIKDINKKEAYIYYLMNNGYSYMEHNIKDIDVTDIEYAVCAENIGKIKGLGIKLDWNRYYPYGSTMRTLLGNIDSIPSDNKDYYLTNGYDISDKVGISYLELEYDNYLKGQKNKYVRYENGSYDLLEEGKKGNDLYLNIDINLQKEVENIIIDNLKKSKYEPNTDYLNKTFVIVSDVKTGGILSIAGKQIINDSIYDYSIGTINSSYAVGSVVKAASHIVGYNTGSLKIGEVRVDDCIKIKNTPEKCSFRYLGVLDDISALKYSSNTYQFRTAMNVGGASYYYNSPIIINENAFETYRTTFKEFGLGVLTNIDLPNETLGIVGSKKDAGLLLDLAIGQYDTYTPIELSQYVTTIANNGIRIKPNILNKIVDNNNKTIYNTERTELNSVSTNEIYLNRVKLGLRNVLEFGGTGSGYIPLSYKPAGKTGTSQTFIDTNNDGMIDTETISTAFVGYFPYDDPSVTITVISPDVAVYRNDNYVSFITKHIVTEVANAYFKRYLT